MNEACAVSVSALILLLVMWTQTGREPPAWVRWYHLRNWVLPKWRSKQSVWQQTRQLGCLGEPGARWGCDKPWYEKNVFSKSGKHILTVYRKNWFWMQIHVALVLLLLLLYCYYLFCVFVCLFFFFGLVCFPMGKKILTLGSEMEKTWMTILCFQYKHIFIWTGANLNIKGLSLFITSLIKLKCMEFNWP